MKIEQVMRPETTDMRMGGEVAIGIDLAKQSDKTTLVVCDWVKKEDGTMYVWAVDCTGEVTCYERMLSDAE